MIHNVREIRNNRDDACGRKFLAQCTMPRTVACETVRDYRNAIERISCWLIDIHPHVLAIEVR